MLPDVEGFLPFHRPTILTHHVQAVAAAVQSGWLTSASKVEEFEKAFEKEVGGKHAVAVNSCTAALHLALIALGIGPGDEVITSPITFASAVNVIEHVGATPVFADVHPENLTLDPKSVHRKVTGATKLVIATHFAGFPAEVDALEFLGVPVITDAAHAIEMVYLGRPSGQLGKIACYSFYATKNITTGEGGMFVTQDDKLAERARTLRLHGMTKDAWSRYGPGGYKHWDITEPGWKYNMSDIQAALGVAQLSDMRAWLEKRRSLFNLYRECLPDVSILTKTDVDVQLAYHLFVIRVHGRDWVMDEMQKRGIGVGVHFRAVHRLKYYQEKYRIPEGSLPEAERASNEVLSLPLYPSMETDDVFRVVKVLNRILSE